MKVSDELGKKDVDKDQNRHNLNHAMKVVDVSPGVYSKVKKQG